MARAVGSFPVWLSTPFRKYANVWPRDLRVGKSRLRLPPSVPPRGGLQATRICAFPPPPPRGGEQLSRASNAARGPLQREPRVAQRHRAERSGQTQRVTCFREAEIRHFKEWGT